MSYSGDGVAVNGLPLRKQRGAVSISAAGWARDATAKGKQESFYRGQWRDGQSRSYWLILLICQNQTSIKEHKIILISLLAGIFV